MPTDKLPDEKREALVRLRSQTSFTTPAQDIHAIIWAHVEVALDAATSRAQDPGAHPCLPQDLTGDYWTRRILADLVEIGLTPDGWEDAYMWESGWGARS